MSGLAQGYAQWLWDQIDRWVCPDCKQPRFAGDGHDCCRVNPRWTPCYCGDPRCIYNRPFRPDKSNR